MKESLSSVLPIALIVILLCLFLVPINSDLLLSFIIGTVMIIVGMALFNVGAEVSMSQIGNHIGSKMTKSKKIWKIVILSFILGVAITVAEPDLQVLAGNTPGIDTTALIITVSVGVGFFLVVSMLRILFGIPLRWLLIVFYALVFTLAAFSNKDFLSVAFDSGGVTTGPMTVPFIMALGVGVASIRSDKNAKSDSFGLVALCSIGPILAVLALGFIYKTDMRSASTIIVNSFENSMELGHGFIKALPAYILEVAIALSPIILFFLVYNAFALRLKNRPLLKILIGLIYTYVGLTLFLAGVNVGFSSLGYVLGESMIEHGLRWLIVPLSMLMGWFIIKAEPAVHVLNKQVSDLTAGSVSGKTMGLTLSIAIAIAMGLAMVRVLTGISVLWFVIPGYAISLILAFVVSPTFTAIAFDAGGVASGPMTATFMLPLAIGICTANGGNVMSDAFGLVTLVAMMPLITVQVMGAIALVRQKNQKSVVSYSGRFSDDETIELWEV